MTDSVKIGSNTQVTLHFSLRLESGEVIEDTRLNQSSATFKVGDGSMLPGFEKRMFGLAAGARRSFLIPSVDAFGLPKPESIKSQRIEDLGDIAQDSERFKQGLVIGFLDAKGQEILGVVTKIDRESAEIDFNHPLAGKDIIFEVDIISVEEVATTISNKISVQPIAE